MHLVYRHGQNMVAGQRGEAQETFHLEEVCQDILDVFFSTR